MKKLFLSTLIVFAAFAALAQAPQKFNYQGVARDNAGKALANQTLSVRLTIHDGSATGTSQYVETQQATTNQFGLYNIQIGGGTAVSGTMNGVTWSTGNKFIQVEIDPAGGNNYTDLGTTQLLSVPYALYAASAPSSSSSLNGTAKHLVKFSNTTSGVNSGVIEDNSGKLGIGTTSPTATLHIVNSTDSTLVFASSSYSSPINQGIIRAEYTGSSNNNNAGIIGAAFSPTLDNLGEGVAGFGGYIGVYGSAQANITGTPSAPQSVGVEGDATVTGTITAGVAGFANSFSQSTSTGTKFGVYGSATNGSSNYAGFFNGDVQVSGSLSKSGGSFKIDHPLDPENKYLYHSFVESPDMMNVYNGNITTDANGLATVQLPDYFDALNKDFRYQLTVIGTFAQAIVYQKVNNNQFVIKTNQPNVEVSWQVTGIRQDAWANAHRIVPEVEKEAENKGKYLTPVEFGKSKDLQIGLLKSAKEMPGSIQVKPHTSDK